MQKVVLSHPTGNANVREVAAGLCRAGVLSEFHTDIAAFPNSFLDKAAQWKPLSELRRRHFPKELQAYTHTSPLRETGRLLSQKLNLKSLLRHEKGYFSIDAIYQNLDKKVAGRIGRMHGRFDSVYAYEDEAVCSFKKAKEQGIFCFYDLPIGYWRAAWRLMKAEYDNRPEWASTLTGFADSQEKLDRKDEELALADHIFVASSFTAKTLEEYPGKLKASVSVIPYGFPAATPAHDYFLNNKRPLNVLFVGGLSQRKGIANLFEAVDKLGSQNINLTIVGRKPVENCMALNNAVLKHYWIPSLPHPEILKLMRTQDVLVFPSLFEGFGLVITEAMSQGTPVITTNRTAGSDLIKHGENGWIVEAGDTESLQSSLENLLINRKMIKTAGNLALETAQARPWEKYGDELAAALMKIHF